jgi:hypothetical protein
MRDQMRQQVMNLKLELSLREKGEEETEILDKACAKLEPIMRLQTAN